MNRILFSASEEQSLMSLKDRPLKEIQNHTNRANSLDKLDLLQIKEFNQLSKSVTKKKSLSRVEESDSSDESSNCAISLYSDPQSEPSSSQRTESSEENTILAGTGTEEEELSEIEETFEEMSSIQFEYTLEERNLISFNQVQEFFHKNANKIIVEYELKRLDHEHLSNLFVFVETFNSIIFNLFCCQTSLTLFKIDINKLLRSILTVAYSKNVRSYFCEIVDDLIEIILLLNRDSISKFNLCNVSLKDLTETYKKRNTELVCWLLVKYFKSVSSPNVNKINLFEKNSDFFERNLDRVNSIDLLSAEMKVELCTRLTDIILGSDHEQYKLTYRFKIQNLEAQMENVIYHLSAINSKIREIEIRYHIYADELTDEEDFKFEKENKILKPKRELTESEINLLNLKKQFSNLKKENENLKRELNFFQRKQPLGTIEILDENIHLVIWHFDFMPDCLIIEKKSYQYKQDEESCIDICSQKSEWHMIDDLEALKKLFMIVNTNLTDSKLVYSILNLIKGLEAKFHNKKQEKDDNVSIFTLRELVKRSRTKDALKSSSENSLQENTGQMVFSNLLIEDVCYFKEKLLRANFIDFEPCYDPTDFSLTGFTESLPYLNFFSKLASLSEKNSIQNLLNEKIDDYKILIVLAYEMIKKNLINTKFIGELEKLWLELIGKAVTFNKLRLLLYIFEKNLKWDKSFQQIVCCLCNDNYSAENTKVFNSLKPKCSKCKSFFHMSCLLQAREKNELEKPETITNLYKNYKSLKCYQCDKISNEEKENTKKLIQEKKEEDSKLNAFEVNKYSLRLNKLRVTNLENIAENEQEAQERPATRGRKAKYQVTPSTSQEDFEPNRKTRKGKSKNKLIPSASDEDFVPILKKRGRKPKNKISPSTSEETFDSKATYSSSEEFLSQNKREIDEEKEKEQMERRERLGLRTRRTTVVRYGA